MPLKYFFLAIFGTIIFLMIARDIYWFGQGKYYPYLRRNKKDTFKKRLLDTVSVMVLVVSLNLASYYQRLDGHSTDFLLAVTFLLLCYFFSYNILNYLSYKKITDRKIIHQTIIGDLMLLGSIALIIAVIFTRAT